MELKPIHRNKIQVAVATGDRNAMVNRAQLKLEAVMPLDDGTGSQDFESILNRILPEGQWFRGAVICSALMCIYAIFTILAFHFTGAIDFAVYDIAAKSLLSGKIPYGLSLPDFQAFAMQLGVDRFAYPYFYPPVTAVLIAPLSFLPFGLAAWIWNLCNAAACVAGTALLLGENRWNAESLVIWCIMPVFIPILSTLNTGQIEGLVYLTVAFSVHAIERGRPVSAGAALALGALIKVTPVILIGHMIWRGNWRAVLGSVLATCGLVLATLPVVGVECWIQYFTVGISTMHGPDVSTYPPNFTINGMLLRLLSENVWTRPEIVAPALVWPLWIGSSLVVVLLTIWACWPPLRARNQIRFEVAFIMIAVQMIAPFTWYHQLTLSVLPACVVGMMAWRSGWLSPRWFSGIVFVTVIIDVYGLSWHLLKVSSILLAIPVLVVLGLWAALGFSLRAGSINAKARSYSPTGRGVRHEAGS